MNSTRLKTEMVMIATLVKIAADTYDACSNASGGLRSLKKFTIISGAKIVISTVWITLKIRDREKVRPQTQYTNLLAPMRITKL